MFALAALMQGFAAGIALAPGSIARDASTPLVMSLVVILPAGRILTDEVVAAVVMFGMMQLTDRRIGVVPAEFVIGGLG